MQPKNKPNSTIRSSYITLTTIILALGGLVFYITKTISFYTITDQLLEREQIIARAGAKSMETYIELVGRNMIHFSEELSLAEDNDVIARQMDSFIGQHKDTPLIEIIYLDKDGKVVHLANNDSSAGTYEVGSDLSSRAYYHWWLTSNSNDYFIGDPINILVGKFQGKTALPMSVRVNDKEGNFRGVIGGALNVDNLTKQFLGPLKLTEESKVMIINSEHNFEYSSDPDLLGKNADEYLSNLGFSSFEIMNLFNQTEMKTRLEPDLVPQFKSKYLAATAKMQVGESQWHLFVVNPYNFINLFSGPLNYQHGIAFTLFVSLVVIYGILAVSFTRKIQYLAFIRGKKAAYLEKEQKENQVR